MANHPATTVRALLDSGADSAVALAAPGRSNLTYQALREQVDRSTEQLQRLGVRDGDRVAIVLPNGPTMASAFLAASAGATAAPLNPAYREQEFEFYLRDLNARMLLVEPESDSAAVQVAQRLGIRIVDLVVARGAPAGVFNLVARGSDRATRLASHAGTTGPQAVALVLHTSGTTSRPKIVPLSQQNLTASALAIAETLALGAHDCGLQIMPLFHIHGLMAGLLAPLAAGGRVFCSPGFNALKFFGWMSDAKPTWYTAVPTMHQAILSRASRNRPTIWAHPLRFIRSSSSSMPRRVIDDLEEAFGAPLIEAYGMTEASHQITSNPLPPRPRAPGTVGVAAGPEVEIMDASGNLLGPNANGEIVIRGANVTRGYENNSAANADSFTQGWLRTGDQGSVDGMGYLTITGRLKEIINRGGEKIAPREVDEVLMDHPAVQQVVTFATPHKKLGEEVAAAIVLNAGAHVTEATLRAFAATRLADFKVPRRILLVPEIPKGPTGKLLRIGLAEKLGLTSD